MLYEVIKLETEKNEVYDLTPQLKELVAKSGLKDGVCIISCPHTTAGICNHSFWDPKGWDDMMIDINRAIPTRIDFKHDSDPATDAAGHVKSALMGTNMAVIIDNGELAFGRSNGVLFAEFDGPRSREVWVEIY